MVERIIRELERRWAAEGNGITITMKSTNKSFECWVQNDGHYLITDKTSIWDKETVHIRTNTIKELAEAIITLA